MRSICSYTDCHHRQLYYYKEISTTHCEALAFIALTFNEARTRRVNQEALSELVHRVDPLSLLSQLRWLSTVCDLDDLLAYMCFYQSVMNVRVQSLAGTKIHSTKHSYDSGNLPLIE